MKVTLTSSPWVGEQLGTFEVDHVQNWGHGVQWFGEEHGSLVVKITSTAKWEIKHRVLLIEDFTE